MGTVTIAQIGGKALRRLGVAVVAAADRPAIIATVAVDDLAAAALQTLGVIDPNETPADADLALAVSKVQSVHAALVAQAIVTWTDGAIPAAVAEEYTQLAAIMAAPAFEKAANVALIPGLEARVRKVAMIANAEPLATDAAYGVHADLVARGIARWSSYDVPDEVSDAYAILTAAALAPNFGATVDPREAAGAERSIYRYVTLPTSGERVQAEYF